MPVHTSAKHHVYATVVPFCLSDPGDTVNPSYKSFKEHSNTTAGLQMINKNTAQQKLLLLQVFWPCRCCKRFNFHSQLFHSFVSGGEHLGAVHQSEHSSSPDEGWRVTTPSQNQSMLVKQLKWFWEICLQVLSTVAARTAHAPTYTHSATHGHTLAKDIKPTV